MISEEEAKKKFSEKFPELTITKIVDYDNNHFVVCAVRDVDNAFEELDPFYAIDKNNGEVSYFSPAGDLKHFGKLMME